MAIGGFLDSFFTNNDSREIFEWEADREGLNFFVSEFTIEKILRGDAGNKITVQYIYLKELVEQGKAEIIPNGFIVPTNVVVKLDRATQNLLQLPPSWEGSIVAEFQSKTGSPDFSVKLNIELSDGSYTSVYKLNGPILEFSPTQIYMLNPEQQIIFDAIKIQGISEKTESDNLQLVLALQDAQKLNAKISLSHFESLNIKVPGSISIEAEIDEDGNLILTPFMGQEASHDRMQQVLGQLRSNKSTSLRVDNEILLFDNVKLAAIQEILSNRKVLKKDIKNFLESPSLFIDASLVNLDCGFSIRVHGAIKFKHSYFGETEESGIDWFGAKVNPESVYPFSQVPLYVDNSEALEEIKSLVKDADNTRSDEIFFKNMTFDVSDKSVVTDTIEYMEGGGYGEISNEKDEGDSGIDSDSNFQQNEREISVVDVDLNDAKTNSQSKSVENIFEQLLFPAENLNWANYKRKPYAHQSIGVRWIMGLALAKEKFGGGLLADDMGLGKTFMALAAVDQLFRLSEKSKATKKPCLVVAPLIVIQNWKEEVNKTFKISPFIDIVVLQSDADLPRYRCGGVETTQSIVDEESTAEIRYSLKVGKSFLNDRLDIPQRLIITTYQTLRDYQFSLCKIDWGMAIFDEAQNIKNPNTLQTRAAMGIKADFKLVATGTPVENSLSDFWCLIQIASFNYLDSYQNFREEYILPLLRAAGDEVDEMRELIGKKLRDKVGSVMLRRLKEDNLEGLPRKNIYVGIENQEWVYEPFLKSMLEGGSLAIYEAEIFSQQQSEENMILTSLQRLRDISLHPKLQDGGTLDIPVNTKALRRYMFESGKLKSLITTLNMIEKRKEKCIIFLVNKRLQIFLSLTIGKMYGLGPINIINGDAKAIAKRKSTPTRISMINEFEERNGFNVIIMSPVAAGVGLTIVGANNVIHLERHWNPAKEAQATDRVYRIGQKKDVNVFIPVLHHPSFESFDVNLHRLLSKKTLLKNSVVTPEQVIPNPGGYGESNKKPQRIITENDLRAISWKQFESLCAELFMKEFSSTSCWLTQEGSDYGADVVLTSNSGGILVQCKHTTHTRYEGYKVIQDVHGAVVKYSKELGKDMGKLIFATNAKILSPKLKKIAMEYNVEIFSYINIAKLLNEHSITFEAVFKRLGKKRLQID